METATKDEMFERGAVTVSGLKSEYGIGRTTAYTLMMTGQLPYTQLGTRRLIPRTAVAALLAKGLVGDQAETSTR